MLSPGDWVVAKELLPFTFGADILPGEAGTILTIVDDMYFVQWDLRTVPMWVDFDSVTEMENFETRGSHDGQA